MPLENTTIEGQLEIDHARGVIYFHAREGGLAGVTVLRIGGLPPVIPRPTVENTLDIAFQRPDDGGRLPDGDGCFDARVSWKPF